MGRHISAIKVLIISTNRCRVPVPVIPFGACLVAESVRKAGYYVRFLDLMFERDPLRAVREELLSNPPDVVGISVRNIDNNDIKTPVFFIKELLPILTEIKRLSSATLILGGAAVSVMPQQILLYTGVPYAVIGDGEVTFPRVLERMAQGKSFEDLPGLVCRNSERYNGHGPPKADLNYTSPDFASWIRPETYLSNFSTIPVHTKIGCHFKCIYCTYRKIEGSNYHLFSPESIQSAVESIAAQGFRDIEFVDSVFNSPPEHCISVCEKLTRAGRNIRFQSLELNPLFLSRDLLTVMEYAGFSGIGVTAESASDSVLERLRKGFNSGDLNRAVEILRKSKLPCLWIFMLGGPGENRKTVRETLIFAEKYLRKGDIVFFNLGIRIYPGTELESIARREGLLSIPEEDMLPPVFYISPQLDFDWLIKVTSDFMDKNLNCINSESIGRSFLPLLHRLGKSLGVAPPLWRHTRLIRRGLKILGVKA